MSVNFRITEPNHTQTPNDLFDYWLPHLGEGELKVLLIIIRKTIGYHKVRDKISLGQLEKFTGLTRTNVLAAVESLKEKKVISKIVIGESGFQQTFYELIVHKSNNSYQSCSNTPPSPAAIPPPSPGKGPTKEKETKEKEIKKQQQEEKAAAPVVVFSILEDLEASQAFKIKISKQYSQPQVEVAMRRLGSMSNVVSIEASLYHLLKHPEEWKDKPKKEDIVSKNLEFLEKAREKIDGRELSNTKTVVGHDYIEFIRGQACLARYTIDQIDFEKLVRAFIGKLKGCTQTA